MYTSLWILSIFMFMLAGVAQYAVSSTIKKNHQLKSTSSLSGAEVAKTILNQNGLQLPVQRVSGNLTDNYSPITKVVSLSSEIYSNNSISSMAVAAHEVGHALQHQKSYPFLILRTTLYPVVSFSGKAFPILLILSIIFSLTNLAYLAVAFYAVSVVFAIITLPVEFDASSRAMKQIKQLNLATESELKEVRSVLNAAAMTYVAAALISIVELLRFIMYFRSE